MFVFRVRECGTLGIENPRTKERCEAFLREEWHAKEECNTLTVPLLEHTSVVVLFIRRDGVFVSVLTVFVI